MPTSSTLSRSFAATGVDLVDPAVGGKDADVREDQ
jgi:hypothetical protein